MRYLIFISLLFMLAGCGQTGRSMFNPMGWSVMPWNWQDDRHDNQNYAPATKGGMSNIYISKDGDVRIALQQPENTREGAGMRLTLKRPDNSQTQEIDPKESGIKGFSLSNGFIMEIQTELGGSETLQFNDTSMGDYGIFKWAGLICCLGGVAITVLSFTVFKVVIPLWAGPATFATGVLTAYMSEAIPAYGKYFLGLLLLVGVGVGIHYLALRKDHPKITRPPFPIKKDSPSD